MEADPEAGLDQSRDAFQEGRWLTYSELAKIRGIGRPSAVKLVQRERWRKLPGNDRDRTVRILVPPEWLRGGKAEPIREDIPDAIPDLRQQFEAANARADAASAAVAAANQRADAALAVADRTLAQLSEATGRIGEAERRAEAERARANQAETDRRAAEGRADTAEARAEAERGRPRLFSHRQAAGHSTDHRVRVRHLDSWPGAVR